ncbi:MAG: hypothetical protein ACKVZ0_19540 [Gemmatimonadales bacterium]
MQRRLTLLLCLLAPIGGALVAQDRMAINLNTHSVVTIDRPATAIWPHIIDPSSWKQGLKSRHHSGPPGEVGEVLAAVDPADPTKVAFFLENVELTRNQRRTIKLYLVDGTLIGFASWTLRAVAGRTVVGYDVHSETRPDPAQAKAMTALQRREAERSQQDANQRRFDEELLALKRLVEASP